MKRARITYSLVSALVALALVAPASAPSIASAATGSAVIPDRRWLGFYVCGAPGTIAPLADIEARTGVRASMSNYFQNVVEQGFTRAEAANAVKHGAVPLITLEFTRPGGGVNQPAYSLKSIASGSQDAYLRTWARDAKAFGHVVWLRPMHEMNGNWYPWGGTVNGNSPADFIAAWRHVHDIFAATGADNVKFVWCPNIESLPNTPDNAIARYWPGDAYVDYLALDGYNFGEGDGIHWRSFESLFAPAYATLVSLSDKPMFVAETGCATTGGDKAAWIAETFRVVPQRFPRFIGLGWFHANADRPWRVDTSAESVAAFSAGAAGEGWLEKAASGVTVASSRRAVGRGRTFTLSGRLAPAGAGRAVVVEVLRPHAKRWAYSSTRRTSASGAYSYRYRAKARGTYRFRVRYRGDFDTAPSLSRTVKVGAR